MDSRNPCQPHSASRYLARMDEYKNAVYRLFPAVPRRVVDRWSIFPIDTLIIGYFLECYPRRVVALDIGTFVGTSAFCLASHPKVSKVISVDPNPAIASELIDKSDAWDKSVDLETLKNLRVLDVAHAALAEFADEREKIQLHEGVVGSTQIGVKGEPLEGLMRVDVPVVDPLEEAGLVALVDGLHTREGVQADLTAIFDRNPRAIVLLDDCRHAWGPFVQAGVVDFMEQVAGEYHFRLIGNLGPGLATSNLGLVYPDSAATETTKALDEVKRMFSQQLDPLRLLNREEELVSIINRTNQEFDQVRKNMNELEERYIELKAQASRLEKRNAQLVAQLEDIRS